MDNGNVVSFYSPWTSTNVFPSDSSTYCTNSDYNSSLSMSCSETSSSTVTDEMENGLLEMDFSNCTLFCPSEKDEFIPFDPPLVSKYGPISRCSKSLIRGPAPIQVNAVSHMGELTSPTSAVRHPLPSASFAPSFYATNPSGFTVPVAIIPEQYLPVVKSASVVVPVAMDCTVCLPNQSELLRINNAEITGFTAVEEYIDDSICQVQTEEFVQEKELNTHILKEELWEIQKTIHEKELNILKSGPQYIEVPYKQKYDLKMGNTVPTSIGPWPSQTLENIPFKPSEIQST
ncbi:hypothetical protein CDAR_427621 [Caerostris darwini]|uniref:Uncharacterized protein n=1 Tax=Caerostris darwini TaxID=1538125 RepID=A0AAV4WV12_9ARAC|nr:hypothetical protein CDAR_427621 [Caerostris darwini]